MVKIVTDKDLLDPSLIAFAIEAVEQAFREKAAGRLVSPPRHCVAMGDAGDLVFTVGGVTDGTEPVAGFRAYTTFNGERDEQVVAIWNPSTGALLGLVIGARLGALRTGAIGGVAIRHMARDDARIVGVIGSGEQAKSQLEAAAEVRRIQHALVYSRNEANRLRFADEMERRLGISVRPVETARQAAEQSDIVICATSSTMPVLDASWLKPGTHVNTVGPKFVDAHELAVEVASVARTIATDSPEQMLAYAKPFFLTDTPDMMRIEDLSLLVATGKPVRRQEDVTLFCSTGLAGTEVLVAAAILERCAPGIEIER
ncbi:ornithine cyclodeaminase family protein [Rhizobium sp. CSW-27]|uniref:ornithine cyclodeaminase family protein n=1 Tax=Rhizobium sp. CSW-27 TaxID=2839985 RepID=UPI001C00A3DB|nr:ornithine cyclodeaminase family protein [Rhizobium sp. CSW-27]MBT9368932.1 ornithine cyclodeaminase family protein [Rhizobium sp. CSW-27]